MKEEPHVELSSSTEVSEQEEIREDTQYITGWRLHGICFWLLLSLFVAQMDTSITSTSILTITDQLGGFKKSSWVFTAYMLPFCGTAPSSPLSPLSQFMRTD